MTKNRKIVGKESIGVKPMVNEFYKLKNNYCVCNQMIIRVTEDKQTLIGVEVKDENNRNKAVVFSARSHPGIQCPNCYLQKRVDGFGEESEIASHKRRYWESIQTRMKQYKFHLMEEVVRPAFHDPSCWLSCCWCLLCVFPRCCYH